MMFLFAAAETRDPLDAFKAIGGLIVIWIFYKIGTAWTRSDTPHNGGTPRQRRDDPKGLPRWVQQKCEESYGQGRRDERKKGRR